MAIDDLCYMKGLSLDSLNCTNLQYYVCRKCSGYDLECNNYIAYKDTKPEGYIKVKDGGENG